MPNFLFNVEFRARHSTRRFPHTMTGVKSIEWPFSPSNQLPKLTADQQSFNHKGHEGTQRKTKSI
ncbi:hypothetical protein AYO50_02355 [Acidobacteria bacterium SCGC AG-212-P17]|nr:hypothetical protein AYO50_02355 [Acidobacteria bacterium SCGC AG-212-P17]